MQIISCQKDGVFSLQGFIGHYKLEEKPHSDSDVKDVKYCEVL